MLAYQAIASARKHIGVIFEVKKKENVIKCLHEKTFTVKLFSLAQFFKMILVVEQNSRLPILGHDFFVKSHSLYVL